MSSILAGICTLYQHIYHLKTAPNDYRPNICPHCSRAGLWFHGCYERKADRAPAKLRLEEPILIPRFFCRHCGKTCSCLPEAIPPRRWYLWSVQQAVLMLLFAGDSANTDSPCHATIRRWHTSLREQFILHSNALRSRFADLGRAIDFDDFWPLCLNKMPFSSIMIFLHQSGLPIP